MRQWKLNSRIRFVEISIILISAVLECVLNFAVEFSLGKKTVGRLCSKARRILRISFHSWKLGTGVHIINQLNSNCPILSAKLIWRIFELVGSIEAFHVQSQHAQIIMSLVLTAMTGKKYAHVPKNN